jgi:elongation factor Ts
MNDYKPAASEIKKLRDKTLAGFQDCQKALVEAGGNMEVAEDIIRKKGLQVAAKKAHREASDGLVVSRVAADGSEGSLVEVNCETDFVAKTPQFQTLANSLADHALRMAPEGVCDGSQLFEQELYPECGKTVKSAVDEVIGQIGENMCLNRTVHYKAEWPGIVHAYIHPPGKIGVLVEIGFAEGTDLMMGEQLAHEMALQIAFSDPSYIAPENIPAEILEKERNLAMEKAREQGKPEHMLAKIAEGMLRKFYADECLLDQPYAKDPKILVRDFIKGYGVPDATVRRYVRFSLK